MKRKKRQNKNKKVIYKRRCRMGGFHVASSDPFLKPHQKLARWLGYRFDKKKKSILGVCKEHVTLENKIQKYKLQRTLEKN